MRVLVTGGAGYVGSVVAGALLTAGHEVLVLDNLQQGHQEAVPKGARFILADIRRPRVIDKVLRRFNVDAVMHMAAETAVGISTTDPEKHFRTNICGGIEVLSAMVKHKVRKLIFSSTAAVYGEPQAIPIDETHPRNPINAYGLSKYCFEQILGWYGTAYGLRHISLRYFNAAGATALLGEDHQPETHLVPRVLSAALQKKPVSVFGTDYPTADGTCVRDYIHVADIARAHVMALNQIDRLHGRAYNLGNQKGCSVLEVVNSARRITGIGIQTNLCPRRPGDPAILVADSRSIESDLGWRPELPDLDSMTADAWKWMTNHTAGYGQQQKPKRKAG